MVKALILALLFASSLAAESATEKALRIELAKTKADLELANARNAAIAKTAADAVAAAAAHNAAIAKAATEAVAAAARNSAASRSVAEQQVGIAATTAINTDITATAAQNQLAVTKKAADDASRNADVARAQAAAANASNTSLLIVQCFAFLTTFFTLVAGFVYKAFERKWDLAETLRKEQHAEEQRVHAAEMLKAHGAQLTQIHALVNSSLTEAKQEELDSREEALVLMQNAIAVEKAAGREPSALALARIAASEAKIADLKKVIADRIKQANGADARLQVELARATEPPAKEQA